jgi:hypothetical protein
LIVVSFFLQVANLAAPVEEWTVGGTALTSLMDVERRHGNFLQVLIMCFLVLNRFLLNNTTTKHFSPKQAGAGDGYTTIF